MFELSSEISISTRPKRNNYSITNAFPVNFIKIRPMFVCVFKCLTKERNCINSIAKTDRVNKSDLNVVATRICSQLIVCPGWFVRNDFVVWKLHLKRDQMQLNVAICWIYIQFNVHHFRLEHSEREQFSVEIIFQCWILRLHKVVWIV